MTSALEELQEEVVGELHTLTKDKLLEICDFLEISGEQRRDVKDKSRIALMTRIMMFLEREEVAELEDGGMSELLLLRDEMTEMISGIDNKTGQIDHDIEPAGTHHRIEELRTVTPQQGVGTEQIIAAKASDSLRQPQQHANLQGSVPLSPNAQLSSYWRKEFKIFGHIGEPGQKEKQIFSSLAHQIENGLNRGYPEVEIVDAVVRAISPGSQLRSYLEGKPQLTLPTLRCILRSHFQEKSATELYKQLASEAQHSKETPQSFLMRVLDLRQKVLFASQESESGLKYDPALVQSMCFHTVLTGLQSDSIRIDMQPLLLESKTSDEVLLEKLNIACANEIE